MAGGPVRNRELISHHQPEEFGKDQKETQHVWPPPRILLSGVHLDWTRRAPPGKTESEWLAKNNLETNPITIKPKTASHVAEQFSWVPLPYCSPPGYPSPIKSLALSAHVSPRTIHFWVLDKSPGRGSPFLQQQHWLRPHLEKLSSERERLSVRIKNGMYYKIMYVCAQTYITILNVKCIITMFHSFKI